MRTKVNLKEIPEKFHKLFECDWNYGNNSEMTSIDRAKMNDLFLEYNKYQIQETIKNTTSNEIKKDDKVDYDNMGFIKD